MHHLQKGPVVKLIHLKNESSVGLPLYVSNLNHLTELEEADISAKTLQKEVRTSSFLCLSFIR